MVVRVFVVGLVVVALSTLPGSAGAQTEGDAPEGDSALLLIMDSSGSMNADAGDGRSKLAAAKDALREVVAEVPEGAPVGLRVYGHRISNDAPAEEGCTDTELVHPVAPIDRAGRQGLLETVDGYEARGYTPIGASLEAAVEDLPEVGRRTVVLVSDGIDTCAPPDACQVARRLGEQGIELKVEAVGFQVDAAAAEQLRCIADATGGSYRDVDEAGGLGDELVALSTRAVRDYAVAGESVVGGASFQEAPVLQPGTYRDTILAQEQLWYAVELSDGQELTAQATLVIGDGDFGGVGAFFEIQLVDPALEDIRGQRGYEVNIGFPNQQRTSNVAARSGVVGGEDGRATEPGTYYMRVTTDGGGDREYPLELGVQVEQVRAPASPSPSPDAPGPAATGAAEDSPTPATTAAAAPADSDDGLLRALVAVLGLAVLALGAAVFVLWQRLQTDS